MIAKTPELVKAEEVPAVTKISFLISGKILLKNNIEEIDELKIVIRSKRVPKLKEIKYFLNILLKVVFSQK